MVLKFSEELRAALFSVCKNNGKKNAFPLVLFKIKIMLLYIKELEVN